MDRQQPQFSCVVLGEQSLLIQCCEELLARGHHLQAVVATSRRIVDWCAQRGVQRFDHFNQLRDASTCDYLFSITNLKMLPDWLLAQARRLAINFHDGPLPRYAGLNAPVWALLNGEVEHGISWHQMAAGADTGPILVGRRFGVAPGETAFSLNTKCYQAGLEGFAELIDSLERDQLRPQPQDLAQRSYYGLSHRPPRAALLDWQRPAEELERLVRALDFGPYPNPVMLPKVEVGGRQLLVRQAEAGENGVGAVGAIEHHCSHTLTVRCASGVLKLLRLTDLHGEPVDIPDLLQAAGLNLGDCLPLPKPAPDLDERIGALSRHEEFWRRRLQRMEPVELPFAAKSAEHGFEWRELAVGVPAESALAALVLLLGRLAGKTAFALACVPAAASAQPDWFGRFFDTVVPLPVTIAPDQPFAALCTALTTELAETEARVGYLRDLRAREPELKAAPDCGGFPVRFVRVARLDADAAQRLAEGAVLTVLLLEDGERLGLLADRGRLPAAGLTALLDHLQALLAEIAARPETPVAELNLLTAADRDQLASFNDGHDNDRGATPAEAVCVHQLFERQAALTPDRVACRFEGESITYRQLNQRANRLAGYLRGRGVAVGDLVGVMVERSIDMLVALYAVHKAGAAYVPLDPVYPHDRLAYMAEDAGLRVLITQRAFAGAVVVPEPVVLEDVAAAVASLPAEDAVTVVTPADLAYVIYTSGSTGKPKGVMVEHRNVVNFFAGMDRRIEAEPGVWLAVTSISFDISVLELFWTLARGFTVVLYADAVRQKAVARGPGRRLEFGFFYWNVAKDENQYDRDKYRLLLDGARFADDHGFNAVWTPERHFASFGGLFPNPSVTCAALATITRNVALRAGSCVVPLHSPIRVAEEWAVVDNLSNGRVGLSIAAGWAPPDFAIKPENFADAKRIMFESAEQVRRLWRGETLMFPGPQGEVPVRTLPRPLQPELPLWVTTAGNIDTFVQAAKAGANVLTHLLGQTVEEVAEKVRAYRRAWAEAGHAGRGVVTLMLHTFVGPDQTVVENAVRGPLKEYLRSAMNLVKAAAWQFPTFKKMSEQQGKTLDEFFAGASAEDMDGLLEFAFQRYFHDSGLFGTPDACLAMVERVAVADVDEIACLIDFGIDTQQVLDHLPWLDRLRETAQQVQAVADASEDYSLPALLQRHAVTHLQCTPSMATMLMADPAARAGLTGLRQMMVGGEAFPPELARSLSACVGGRVTNMYGPTETTIWSAVGDVERERPPANNVSIGRPLPNQSVYVLDERQQPLPVGVAGELVIGGAGVVRGYWQRPELTAERFLADRFAGGDGRMYRTGDLARWLPDGRIECLGRVDHQVKIRGYRVELGEIEALLRNCEGVAEAAVVLREDVAGDQRLVAYLRPAPGVAPTADALKQALRRQLPDFMVPSAYVELAALPLTPNGKIDRKALPAPRVAAVTTAHSPPQNEAEAMIAAIWQQALGVERVGTRDNFFDIGGHSLLVVQVLKELRERVAKPIQMTDLFKYTTVEALARFIGADDGGPEQPLDRGLARAEARRAALDRRRRR